MEWWSEIWLNEGFACWMEHHAIAAIFPQWDIWQRFSETVMGEALRACGMSSSHAMEFSISHPREVSECFDSVSYRKAAAVIRMLEHFLGHEVFRAGLRTYLRAAQYGNSDANALWRHLTEASRAAGAIVDVAKLMHRWIHARSAPLIYVERVGSEIRLRQTELTAVSRKRRRSDEENTEDLFRIPLLIRTCDSELPTPVLMTGREFVWSAPFEFEGLEPWVLINTGRIALCRVQYSLPLLDQLNEAIQHKELGPTDRLTLLDDTINLSRLAACSATDSLSLLSAFRAESRVFVLHTFCVVVSSLSRLVRGAPRGFNKLKNLSLGILSPIALELGFVPLPTDSPETPLVRSLVVSIAISFAEPRLVAEARKRFAA
eukprot:981102_1